MTRTTSTTADLPGHSIDELKVLRRNYSTALGRNTLKAVIILTEGNSVKQIVENKIFSIDARKTIDQLYDKIEFLYEQFNQNQVLIMSVAYARNYYFDCQYEELITE